MMDPTLELASDSTGMRRLYDRPPCRLLLFLAMLMGVLAMPPSASAASVSWELLPGRATDIGVGANGAVWAVGSNPVPGGKDIYQWVNGRWVLVPGGAVRIAVGPTGQPWVVNNEGSIFSRTASSWRLEPGSARDIAVSPAGTVYTIGTTPRPGGFGIYQYVPDFGSWSEIGGGGVRIAAGNKLWVVNDSQRIFRRDANDWVAMPGNARDVGASREATWIVGTTPVSGGFTIHRFDGVAWDLVSGGAVAVSVAPGGHPWVVNSVGQTFRGSAFVDQAQCPVEPPTVVPESLSSVAPTVLQPGESIRLTPDPGKQIWAGVILTGWNGPEGWTNTAPSSFPLPGARSFSLLVSAGSGWRYLGASPLTVQNTTGAVQPLRLGVNDNEPGNGRGQFEVGLTYTCRT